MVEGLLENDIFLLYRISALSMQAVNPFELFSGKIQADVVVLPLKIFVGLLFPLWYWYQRLLLDVELLHRLIDPIIGVGVECRLACMAVVVFRHRLDQADETGLDVVLILDIQRKAFNPLPALRHGVVFPGALMHLILVVLDNFLEIVCSHFDFLALVLELGVFAENVLG